MCISNIMITLNCVTIFSEQKQLLCDVLREEICVADDLFQSSHLGGFDITLTTVVGRCSMYSLYSLTN